MSAIPLTQSPHDFSLKVHVRALGTAVVNLTGKVITDLKMQLTNENSPDVYTKDEFLVSLMAASQKDGSLKWLAANEKAAEMVHQGLEQSKRGRGKRIGSFAKYAKDE